MPVRFEPGDMSIAYAMVAGRWIELTSRFADELKGRSERELQIVRDEYAKRRSDVECERLNDKTFVEFLKYIDHTESILLQRRRTLEMLQSNGSIEADILDGEVSEVDEVQETSEVVKNQAVNSRFLFNEPIVEFEFEFELELE